MAKYTYVGEVTELRIDQMPKGWWSRSYSVSTRGEKSGSVWFVKEKGEVFYTVSAGVEKTGYGKGGFKFSFKRHYVLTQLGLEEIQAMIVERELDALAGA